MQFSISRPQDFRAVSFDAEHVEPSGRVRGGDKLVLYADDVRVSIMAHADQPAVRVVLAKVGRRRYNPNQRLNDDPDGE